MSQPELQIVAAQLPLQGLRVLVVDDDEPAREVLRAILEAEGAAVWTAASCAEALTSVDAVQPDVMLADIGMPVADGFLLVRQLRLRPSHKGGATPVAALTGYLSAVDRERASRAGFQDYLIKPVDPGDLIRSVKTLASMRSGEPLTPVKSGLQPSFPS